MDAQSVQRSMYITQCTSSEIWGGSGCRRRSLVRQRRLPCHRRGNGGGRRKSPPILRKRRDLIPRRERVNAVLLGMDEYPYHQITATFAGVAGTDPGWNDGHYICLSDMDGEVALASTLRLYQNNDVTDGFVCVRHAGRQHNIRVSRRLRPDMGTLTVGPLRLEIVEPLRAVRLVLEENEFGIALDVICRSSVLPYEGPAEVTRIDGRLISERITYEVTGKCEGWVQVDGSRIQLACATDSFF